MKVKLTELQHKDLVAAAAHPEGRYKATKPNCNTAQHLTYQRLLVSGPLVLEEKRAAVLAEAAEHLRAAAAHAEAGELYEAEAEAWEAQHCYARLTNHSGALYITDLGRAAAANGFYRGRD